MQMGKKNGSDKARKKSNINKSMPKKGELDLLTAYRKNKTVDAKVKMMSKLKSEQKKTLWSLLNNQEKSEYRNHTSMLIEKRYSCIKRNKKCLDALTADYPDIGMIKRKYINWDVSIPVYTIKAIINTYKGNGFSRDDGKRNRNTDMYYHECKKYWEIITSRWYTDTGVLSKEEIENKQFSERHRDANKVKTIVVQLEKRYPKIDRFCNWCYVSDGHKRSIAGPEEFQRLLLKEHKKNLKNKNIQKYYKYRTLDGFIFSWLNKDNFAYLVDRDRAAIDWINGNNKKSKNVKM